MLAEHVAGLVLAELGLVPADVLDVEDIEAVVQAAAVDGGFVVEDGARLGVNASVSCS
ncbi:hypothetical protein [Streptomyces clavifer]|uniref:hypothetical protein n=1 Tax=Streptomyces clavifer TaxID=68188 RepID=UPI00308CEC0E|nr:hypothetical protein OG388_01345 [Streptomyces clavifer]WRY86344.1 hypothetical protein OG388_36645 [Streptomyces clavifer]